MEGIINAVERNKPEKKSVWLERFLRSRLFVIVVHYDKKAVANPPVVQKVIEEIIDALEEEHYTDGRDCWGNSKVIKVKG